MSQRAPDDLDLSEWIPLAEAARRLPSPRPGKKTHVATIYRLCVRHNLTVMRRGPWRFVRWVEVRALFQPERRIELPPTLRQERRNKEWADQVLRNAGIIQ